ncbi:MAG: hypothetical protein F6K28_44780 [Microcoleus sp. SIO2G3]|nr:hypothetical protein [Microcoleus sp. SIO2G3]
MPELLKNRLVILFRVIKYKFLKRLNQLANICICVGLLTATTWGLREYRAVHRTEIYRGIYEYLDSTISPTEKISYLLSSRSYLFYGKHFDKTVLHVPLIPGEAERWFQKIQQAESELIAAGPLEQKEIIANEAFLSITNKDTLVSKFGRDVENEPVLYQLERN